MPRVDYARELSAPVVSARFLGLAWLAADDTKALRFRTPALAHAMGAVWSALDVWVAAERPMRPERGYQHPPYSPFDRLRTALMEYYWLTLKYEVSAGIDG